MQHSAIAQAIPPSATSWADARRPERTAARTNSSVRAWASRSTDRSGSSARPSSLAASEPARAGAKAPTSAIS
jgi:hypothetical protein